jgi:Pyridoxamine 5'-phosphate oxidase
VRLPAEARQVLERAPFCYVAVRTPRGPHLTPVVFVLDGGRLWLTTSRLSIKARAWRGDPTVAGLVRYGDRTAVFRGRVRTYDALDPLSWPAATLGAPSLVRAATRFGLKNARFFAGYAVDAHRVPWSWTPPARVFARVELAAGCLLDADGVVAEWGEWSPGLRSQRAFPIDPRRRSLDLRVPRSILDEVTRERAGGDGALAVDGEQLTVVPVRWRRVGADGGYDAVLPVTHAELAVLEPEVPAALTIDRTSRWRASDMLGLLLQGCAFTYDPTTVHRGRDRLMQRIARGRATGRGVLVHLRPTRVVWWRGWSSGAVGERSVRCAEVLRSGPGRPTR